MKQILNNLNKLAKDKHIENKKYFDKLKRKPPKNLDYQMQELHDAEFETTFPMTRDGVPAALERLAITVSRHFSGSQPTDEKSTHLQSIPAEI